MRQFEKRTRGKSKLTIVILIMAVAFAVPLVAQDGPETRWRLRAEPMFLIAAGGDEAGLVTTEPAIPEAEPASDTNEQSIDHGPGFGLGLEYLATRKLGVEASVMIGTFDASYELVVDGVSEKWDGDIDFTAFTIGLNYHLTPAKKADWFLGLFWTSYDYDDLTFDLPGHGVVATWTFVANDGWGYRGGVDIDLGEDNPWFLAVGVRHFRGSFDVHPVMVSVGVGRRF